MQIDDELLGKLQRLAMIEIDDEHKEKVRENLSEILNFVENLNSIDTDSITVASNEKTPLRDDEPKQSTIAKEVLENAPSAQDGFFIVPKIIE